MASSKMGPTQEPDWGTLGTAIGRKCVEDIPYVAGVEQYFGAIICMPQTVGSTMGAGAIMGMNLLGVGFKAMLFSSHVDSIAAGGTDKRPHPVLRATWRRRASCTSWRPGLRPR